MSELIKVNINDNLKSQVVNNLLDAHKDMSNNIIDIDVFDYIKLSKYILKLIKNSDDEVIATVNQQNHDTVEQINKPSAVTDSLEKKWF